MKFGLIISALLHASLLGWGLFWLSAPKSFEVADIEALPVDIIPVSSITRIQEGEREAPAAERAAPRPTERPEPVEDAQNVGNNTVDLKTSRSENPKPKTVEAAQEPEQVLQHVRVAATRRTAFQRLHQQPNVVAGQHRHIGATGLCHQASELAILHFRMG